MNMESAVRVIDGVFSADATAALRAHALRMSRVDTELAAFYERGAPTNPIETGLDSFLAQVGDAGSLLVAAYTSIRPTAMCCTSTLVPSSVDQPQCSGVTVAARVF